MFSIKPDYRENPQPVYFLDDVTETRGIVFQPDVYTFAELLAELARIETVIDIGCGWGDKLAAIHDRHPDWTFIGIDHGANLAHCRKAHPWGEWLELDLEQPQNFPAAGAVVVCSDVIEHLADPQPLVWSLRTCGARAVIISTPERDVQHGYDHSGPPPNLCHIREWNTAELRSFLETEGFAVRHSGLTRGNDQGWAMATQLLVVTP